MKVIWDLGSNNGSDIDYYLRIADRVVAIEAIPGLCSQIQSKFRDAISQGRLFLYNKVLALDGQSSCIFYIHKHRVEESTTLRPGINYLADFDIVTLPTIELSQILDEHGLPWYVKIDLEGLDFAIVNLMFNMGIIPEFLSAEVQDLRVASLIAANPCYKSFNLVNGRTLPLDYGKAFISTPSGKTPFKFNPDMSGPMGLDISSPWLCPASILRLIAVEGAGWKDIHASRSNLPSVNNMSLVNALLRTIRRRIVERVQSQGIRIWRSF